MTTTHATAIIDNLDGGGLTGTSTLTIDGRTVSIPTVVECHQAECRITAALTALGRRPAHHPLTGLIDGELAAIEVATLDQAAGLNAAAKETSR